MPNSYNGWPASPSGAVIGIDTKFSAAGATFPGGVKSGDVSTVFRYLIERLNAEVEAVHPGWCWGYEYRANVNNPSQLSCHASGTAIDYNAPNHSNGTSVGPGGGGGWSAAQYRQIQKILADLGGVVRWLTGNDPMHFEIYGSAAGVAAVAARIRGGGAPSTPSTPTPPAEADWFDMATKDDLRAVIAEMAPQIGREAIKALLNQQGDGMFPYGDLASKQIADYVWSKAPASTAGVSRGELNEVAQWIVQQVQDYDVVIYEDQGGLWWSEGGESTHIPDPSTLDEMVKVAKAQNKQVLFWPGGEVSIPGAFGARDGVIPGPDAPEPAKTYTVVGGDSFNAIAKKLGVTPEALKATNPQITDVNNLAVGQVLNVPK